jgi:hypothetical protein
MSILGHLAVETQKRDKYTCQVCGVSARPALTVHHIVPVSLNGRDALSNLVVLCENCHRCVHWLATGDRSCQAHAYGLGRTRSVGTRLLRLARRIRDRRKRIVGVDRVLSTAVPLATAIQAVIARNGIEPQEAHLLKRCFDRAWRAVSLTDRRACSIRLVRGARYISVNANNHLAIRIPAWSDYGYRIEGDILLIWPQAIRPSIMSVQKFQGESSSRFKLIPHFNLSLTWEECLDLQARDWRVFRGAVHDGLTAVHTRRWISNVLVK